LTYSQTLRCDDLPVVANWCGVVKVNFDTVHTNAGKTSDDSHDTRATQAAWIDCAYARATQATLTISFYTGATQAGSYASHCARATYAAGSLIGLHPGATQSRGVNGCRIDQRCTSGANIGSVPWQAKQQG
jgi:hypothetical protein